METVEERTYKPQGYVQIPYAPAKKIDSEAKLEAVEQTKLEHSYTYWVMIWEQNYKNKNNNFDQNLLELTTVDTVSDFLNFQTMQVETFWMVQQHLRRATAMPYGTFLHVFKQGIKPMWEDPSLVNGCRFSIKTQKSHTSKYWEDLLLAMLGEQFQQENHIAGLVLNLKAQ